ncbi:hypothetical protein [Gordonia liuliyuniae]|uniref:Ribbon-helix-helix protein, copG family n=1 Tax=Gordonia liuliyuniae TaxID=2911517 RepID=A0ABS9IS50_9ACTN|nr:hypothetical protein [Gordonia liuliyuniae]MCF8588396.1 hypothetical protein [Gordonia liuliyuniae]
MSTKKMSRLEQALAEADEIEQNPDRVVRNDVKVTRGHGRARTLQVRLNDDEMDAIEAIAAERELPVSTVARDILLQSLDRVNVLGHHVGPVEIDYAIETLAMLRDDPALIVRVKETTEDSLAGGQRRTVVADSPTSRRLRTSLRR